MSQIYYNNLIYSTFYFFLQFSSIFLFLLFIGLELDSLFICFLFQTSMFLNIYVFMLVYMFLYLLFSSYPFNRLLQ